MLFCRCCVTPELPCATSYKQPGLPVRKGAAVKMPHHRLSSKRTRVLTSPFFPISLYASPILSFCRACRQRGKKSQWYWKSQASPWLPAPHSCSCGAALLCPSPTSEVPPFQRRDNGRSRLMCTEVQAMHDRICLATPRHLKTFK